jgi:hypothetical protein
MLTHERLKELLSYDAATGVLRWRVKTNRRIVVNSVAGTINDFGYRVIRLDGQRYRAHRLVWFYEHGGWPKNDIDHINGKPDDNRLENLRDVTTAENIQNQVAAHRRNRSGRLGVTRRKHGFEARIYTHGVAESLGVFDTAEEAEAAYIKAKRIRHSAPRHQ